MSARPKLATVAALAGLSPSTASLALRGSSRVSSPTRERVEAAAAQLGGTAADPVARSLRSRRTGIGGAVVSERLLHAFRDPVALQVLDGVTEVLGPLGAGCCCSPATVRAGALRPSGCGRSRWTPRSSSPGPWTTPALDVLRQRGVPVGVAEGPYADDLALVAVADRAGSAYLARHLHDLGHRRVAVVALPLRLDGTAGPLTVSRLAGVPGWVRPRRRSSPAG